MNTILVPTDFSNLAKDATDLAVELAKKIGAKVMLLHVVEDSSVNSVHYTGELAMPGIEDRLFIHKLIDRAKIEFDAIKANHKGINIEDVIRVGNPYYSVKDIIREYDIDLIVMGTKGSKGVEEILIGSTAEKVVRHSKCPVLTVHGPTDGTKLKNIAFATGLKEAHGKHVEFIKEMEKFYKVKTHIVRVNTPNNFQTDSVSIWELKEYAKESGILNYEVRVYNDVTEEEGILHFAEEIDADLIVMATHGRTGLAHLIAGSIAEEVVNHTKRPVLTFPIKN